MLRIDGVIAALPVTTASSDVHPFVKCGRIRMAVVRQKERVGDKSEHEGSPSEVSLPILARVKDGGRDHAQSGLCPTEVIRSSVETPQTLDLSRYGLPCPLISASLRFVERDASELLHVACDQGGVQTQCPGRDEGLE